MKERLAGIGLTVGTALILGPVWANSAQAFSLGSPVIVENFLVDSDNPSIRIPYEGTIPIVQGPTRVVVTPPNPDSNEPTIELKQFGGIWDIDLDDNFISFSLNSLFTNVSTGTDVYRFIGPNTGKIPTIKIFSFTPFSSKENERPYARFTAGEQLRVDLVFPRLFAPGGLLPPEPGSTPMFVTNVQVEPHAIPTPALLPGLVGMGLAALRKQRGEKEKHRVD
ncbi:PTPA-CTERM sorting domain-containing protein [Leptolyngbya sp. KIOST-1]|uniref:PTPA-CTERM sorting domain-containing protein n=1 Tax=Leptolyngbya sp. KIOST-1 TaxID=1229172 RepID=UPI0005688141|nr:PTPA-CTERM sorting domain-containing protein [Leptolyngbya sp. KIOST-1]